jgi:hypothetical protein
MEEVAHDLIVSKIRDRAPVAFRAVSDTDHDGYVLADPCCFAYEVRYIQQET